MPKGLPSRFSLERGCFLLTDGTTKARDAIWFYCIFDKFRIYTSDYGAGFYTLLQKSASYLLANRTLILGNLRRGISKYVSYVTVKNLYIGYLEGRTSYAVMVEYTSPDDTKTEIRDVTFI